MAAADSIATWRETLFGAAPLTRSAQEALTALVEYARDREEEALAQRAQLKQQEDIIQDLEDLVEKGGGAAPESPAGVEYVAELEEMVATPGPDSPRLRDAFFVRSGGVGAAAPRRRRVPTRGVVATTQRRRRDR